MKTKRSNGILNDILKRVRKENREEEIRLHGKPIRWCHIVKSKKQYTRKNKHKNSNEEF